MSSDSLVRRARGTKPVTGMDGEAKVRAYPTPHEAELAAAHLRSLGIDARLDNQMLVGMNPLWDTALGGVKVLVPNEQLRRAKRALAKLDARLAVRGDEEDEDDDLRSSTDEGDAVAARAFRSAILGLFVCPLGMHVYALWLLGSSRAELSERGRRRAFWAKLVSWVAIAAVAITVLASTGAGRR